MMQVQCKNNRGFLIALAVLDLAIGLMLIGRLNYGFPMNVLYGSNAEETDVYAAEAVTLVFSILLATLLIVELIMIWSALLHRVLRLRRIKNIPGYRKLVSDYISGFPLMLSAKVLFSVQLIYELFMPAIVFRDCNFIFEMSETASLYVFRILPVSGMVFMFFSSVLSWRQLRRKYLGRKAETLGKHSNITSAIAAAMFLPYDICWLLPGMINGYWYCFAIAGYAVVVIGALFIINAAAKHNGLTEKVQQ